MPPQNRYKLPGLQDPQPTRPGSLTDAQIEDLGEQWRGPVEAAGFDPAQFDPGRMWGDHEVARALGDVNIRDYLYPSLMHDALSLRNAARLSNEHYEAAIRALDKEENAFQEWYKQRSIELGLSPDSYDPMHMFDYKKYWREEQEMLKAMEDMSPEQRKEWEEMRADRRRGLAEDELPSTYDWRTDEGEAEIIRKAKEAFGDDWSFNDPTEITTGQRTGRSPKYIDIKDLRTIEGRIRAFDLSKSRARKKNPFPLVGRVSEPGSYFETYKTDKGVGSVQKQSEIEYAKLLNKNQKPSPYKKIARRPPDPHPKGIMPEPDTGKAPPEVTEQLGGMDPSVMEELRKNPQLRSIFGLE